MSNSFVKDCSDVSADGNTNCIIIVDSNTGNFALDSDSIQNLLGNQVSVLHLGGTGHENYNEESSENLAIPVSSDGATHVNVTLEGFSSIPIDSSTGNYAELPLDADAFQRLESVLESEEARKILGEPLLNIVNDPDNLESLDLLCDPNILAGDSINESLNETDNSAKKGLETSVGNDIKIARQSSPKRRSQRQQDKATKEEVEKILAENYRQFEEEKAKMKQKKILVSKNELPEEKKVNQELENKQITENIVSMEEKRVTRRGRGLVQENKKTQEVAAITVESPRGRRQTRGNLKNTTIESETKVEPVRKGRSLEVEKNKNEREDRQ